MVETGSGPLVRDAVGAYLSSWEVGSRLGR